MASKSMMPIVCSTMARLHSGTATLACGVCVGDDLALSNVHTVFFVKSCRSYYFCMTQETVRRLPFRCHTRKGSDLDQSQQTNKMALTPALSRKCPGAFQQ